MLLLRRCAVFVGIVVIAAGVLIAPAFAAFTPTVSVHRNADKTAAVVINYRTVITLRTPNGTLSPAERAEKAAERLIDLMQKGLNPQALSYKVAGQSARVLAGDTLILIATPAEATAHRMSVGQLAGAWIRNVRAAMAMQPLTVDPKELLVPLGESRTVNVQSLIQSQVSADVTNSAVIEVDPLAKPGSLVVTGLANGESAIKIQSGEYSVTVRVAVKSYAASIPGTVGCAVTGRDVPVSLIRRAAADAARMAATVLPGASIRSVSAGQVSTKLNPGQRTQVPVVMEVAGADYIPARLSTQVQVEDRPLPGVPATWIMYSNDPERLERYQVLFTGKLNPGDEATRLLYHHQNMMGRKIGFTVEVINPSDMPASLHVAEGISAPMVDTVLVGYVAGAEFLRNLYDSVGRIVEFPPMSRRVLVSQTLDNIYTASGLLEFHQLSGQPLIVRVIAKPDDQRLASDPVDQVMPMSAEAITPALSDHVYPQPVLNVDASYTAGKSWTFLRLGKDAIKHLSQKKQLDGNYGVVYNIKAALENPTSVPQQVELILEATAGEVYGAFYIQGEYKGVKNVRPPTERSVATFTIPAGKTEVVSIRTIPLSGSAYPATLVIRPVQGGR